MTRKKTYVVPNPDGRWTVNEGGRNSVYQSKVEAVTQARSSADSRKVIVKTLTGQVVRPAHGQTSVTPTVLRDAVLTTIRNKTR